MQKLPWRREAALRGFSCGVQSNLIRDKCRQWERGKIGDGFGAARATANEHGARALESVGGLDTQQLLGAGTGCGSGGGAASQAGAAGMSGTVSSALAPGSKQLSAAEAASMRDVATVLGGWSPSP